MPDGIDHINIYSKGETKLGRDLSNFAALSVRTCDGSFASLEAYWYWLSCPSSLDREKLRHLTGYDAKALGRSLRGSDYSADPLFKLKVVAAMVDKLLGHPALCEALRESTLPFRHYYVYGGGEVTPANGQWVVEVWEMLRRLVQQKTG